MNDRYLQDTVDRAIARLIYERRTARDWHTSHVDPGADPYYLTLARDWVANDEPIQPTATTLDEVIRRTHGD